MEKLESIFIYLDGKKTSISMIISAVLVFCLGRHYIANDTAYLISGICLALGISINVAEYKLGLK